MTDLPTDSTHDISSRPVGKRQRARRRTVMMQWLAAGIGAGLISGMGARSAQATNGDYVQAGQTVDATLPTAVRNSSSGITPDTTADGLQGYATGANNSGLFGRNNTTDGIGVGGAAPSGTGVFGESSNGYGVGGRSSSSYGVYGTSTTAAGVYGESAAGYPTAGVYGKGTGSGPGMRAVAVNSVGLVVESGNNIGVYSTSASGSGTAIYGVGISGARAAYFGGNVDIVGALTVNGSNPKSAAVPHPDGTLRRLYCMESPESWFEDFGSSQLSSGRAQVSLDREFALLVKTDGYQVFPIPEGDCKGLYITNKTSTSFEVRELQGGTSAVSFSYRIVARRKDIAAPRLEKVELPKVTLPDGTSPVSSGPVAPASTGSTPIPTATPQATPTPAPATVAPATSTPSATATSTSPPATTATPTALPTRTPPPGALGSPAAN